MPLTQRHGRWIAVLLIVVLLATACSDSGDDGSAPDGGPTGQAEGGDTDNGGDDRGGDGAGDGDLANAAEGVTVRIEGSGDGDGDTEIVLELSDASRDDGNDAVRNRNLEGDALDDDQAGALLDRLPELEADEADQVGFRRPPETRPRPVPGTTIDQAFPPSGDADVVTTDPGPLEVLRYQPEGPVDLAPFIAVTFNQPMVPLTTVDQVEANDIPISVTPEMPGRWIWLGARTVRFEYEPGAIDRIPAATKYRVEIPAGTTALNGAELGEGVAFEFTTPTPQVKRVVPFDNHQRAQSLPTDPLIYVEFDQRVNADEALAAMQLITPGGLVDLRLATGEEINEDPAISALTENALPDRWVAIKVVEPLPTSAEIRLAIGPDLPSAEGPETSDKVSEHSGRTYGALRVTTAECGWGDECQPGQPFRVEFSNQIDAELFRADFVRIEPEIPGLQIGVSYNSLSIQGRTAGRTTYDITIDAELTDIFGQQLGEDTTRSITVGDATPTMFSPGRGLVTLDPIVGDERLNVTTINHDQLRLTAYAVDPTDDWVDWQEHTWEIARGDYSTGWDVLAARTIDVNSETNAFTETPIDLATELADNGHVVVVVRPEPPLNENDPHYWRSEPFALWVQSTDLGLDVVTDNDSAIAWVTSLASGEPVSGATVTMIGAGSADTNNDGIATLGLPDRPRGVLAEHDGDTALVGEFWASRSELQDQARWYVIDDRGLYKPGETAHLKGFIRIADAETPADLRLPGSSTDIDWLARDAFGNEIDSGTAPLSDLGGFDVSVELPDDITLGNGSVEFTRSRGGQTHWHELRIQEFRRPDFEVAANVRDDGPHLAGEHVTIDATAEYFAGGPLAGAELEWNIAANLGSYSPPNWPDYNFGIWVPWWFGFNEFEDGDFGGGFDGFSGGTQANFSTATGAAGEHALAVLVDTDGKPRPVSMRASATVFDVNRQPISNSTTALVHPSKLYVGLRGPRTFIPAGEVLSFDVIVTDIDGETSAGHDVTLTSSRLEWQFQGGSWTEVEVPDEACEVTSVAGPASCEFRPGEGGRYRIAAQVTDGDGRTNLTEVTRWVAGGSRPPSRRVDLEQLTLVPDAETWQPGDTAEILVQAPFANAHGLVVISRNGIDRTETLDFDSDGSTVLRVPIAADDIPGLGLQIEVVGTAPRASASGSALARPAYASGQLTLSVPPDSRTLTLDVAPRQAQLEPGSDTQVDVAVTDASGEPVADAELAVIVVDEAVLSLTGYQLSDPLEAFYQRNSWFGGAFRGRATLRLSDPDNPSEVEDAGELLESGSAAAESADFAMADSDDAMEESGLNMRSLAAPQAPAAAKADDPAIELRTDFNALAVFEPEVTTDADGKATIDVPLPDNLTRYRIMVVATAAATDAGTGESNLTARLPVTARPTPPRFANFGDTFEFPVVVQNATDEDREVDVALRSTNLAVDGRSGTTVTVPANDRVEVRFDVSAVEAGTARYQVAVSSGSFADAAQGSFPIYTPATAEAFATYGVIDSGNLAQAFEEPQNVFPQFGGLEITTSSTAVSALTDAVIYLSEYRYDNSDAFASRIIAITSLDDILDAFDSEQLPAPEALRAVMVDDIGRLERMQNDDGGFPYWRRGRDSIPYNTVQVTHALLLARQSGYEVNEQVLANAMFYLAEIEDRMPSWYGTKTRQAISAYALHVREIGGDRDATKATGLFRRAGDDIELDVAAWLWPVVADTEIDAEIELLLNNRVTETANAATFATRYAEEAWVLLHSDRRTDAIVLDALVSQRPNSDLIVKTLNGLLAARGQSGYWRNAQENAFVLLASSAYFDAFEDVDPDFVARAWLGDTYALEHTYDGRSTERNATLVPMSELVDVGDTDIVLDKAGADGRLYYRLGLRYAPTDFDLAPRDQGFVVERTYEAIDDDRDVTRNDDGSWTVRAGARVRVRLAMVADSRRTHVALIDPIPAGFEIVNPALATSEPIPQVDPSESAYFGFWWYRWFDHQNARDDRAEAFATWLGAGTYEYTYVARATTPGTFITPPARAEQMYEPEVFGRSASTTVQVVDG